MVELSFINLGDGRSSERAHANSKTIRQHVRRAVIRKRARSSIDDRIKHFTGTEFVVVDTLLPSKFGAGTAIGHETTSKSAGTQCGRSHPKKVSGTRKKSQKLDDRISTINTQPVWRHPYTDHAAVVVDLPIERINALFQNPLFRNATEPLFAPQDHKLHGIENVFPGSLKDGTFFSALLFSTLQMINHGTPTPESLELQKKALRGLRRKMLTSFESLSPADIGSVLILQGVAYRWNDIEAYEIHTQALLHIRKPWQMQMPMPTEEASCWTQLIMRAMFWQDLTAALVIGSKRHADACFSIPRPRWRRATSPTPFPSRPAGFKANADIVPAQLLHCIEDIIEMQELTSLPLLKVDADAFAIDNMQASIESRLAWDTADCAPLTPVSDCVRLATLITCFLAFNKTWANSLVPSLLSDMLLKRFAGCITDQAWEGRRRRPLQVWCALAGSFVTTLPYHAVERLGERWSETLLVLATVCGQGRSRTAETEGGGVDYMHEALTKFVYCDGWVLERRRIKGWRQLESSLSES